MPNIRVATKREDLYKMMIVESTAAKQTHRVTRQGRITQ
jgi:hypothetical protein